MFIWNIKATGAKTAFDVSAYKDATLDNFRLDHLDIEARTAGTIASARNWTMTDNRIQTADGSKPVFTDTPAADKGEIAYGEPVQRVRTRRRAQPRPRIQALRQSSAADCENPEPPTPDIKKWCARMPAFSSTARSKHSSAWRGSYSTNALVRFAGTMLALEGLQACAS